jgi:hypothetical protein
MEDETGRDRDRIVTSAIATTAPMGKEPARIEGSRSSLTVVFEPERS